MVCLTILNRSVIPLCWNFGGRTFECPFVGRLGFSEPHSHDIQPQGFSVWASVSLLSHPPKSHARFSFGVKLNLTIFLLESEIPSPLHFCGAPSIERILALSPSSSPSDQTSFNNLAALTNSRALAITVPFGLIIVPFGPKHRSTFLRRYRSLPKIIPSFFLLRTAHRDC